MRETITINASLSALNQCIRALTDPAATHVPYIKSKLMWALQDSLDCNAKTVLLAVLSPAAGKQLSTLQCAVMAKRMPNNLSINLHHSRDEFALLAEAEAMCREEAEARKYLCSR